jgi:CheY-like chemotaxis protein
MSESSKIQTLIIEDEETFLAMLKSVLQSTERFTVTSCESGDQGLEELKKTHFDLVILDDKLPGMSGLNVLQWMHEQKMDTPVIMLTGAGSENLAVEAMKLGAYDYVRKDQFDRNHFPILASGVYERFLFHRESKGGVNPKQAGDRTNLSLDFLEKSIYALTQDINASLTVINLIAQDSQSILEQLSHSESTEVLQKNIDDTRQEYLSIAAVIKSITELTNVMFSRYSRSWEIDQFGKFPSNASGPNPPETFRNKLDKTT